MSLDRFEDLKKMTGLNIAAAAKQAGVSTATILNWLKAGYLTKDANGLIDKFSFAKFINGTIGSEKLHSRANKSKKDSHNHNKLAQEMCRKISDDTLFYDSIGLEYEKGLSDSYKNKEGIFYTPQDIVDDMLPLSTQNFAHKKFCDPCCGSGNFILRAIEIGFKPENTYGFDIDPIAVAITKKRILKKTGYSSDNILQADFLDYIQDKPIKFDYIYTNPPWGKKIQKRERERYAAVFISGKSLDTSALFFFASFYCLAENGSLGFLLPEAFFTIAAFESARIKALELSIERLIDYGKSFKGLLTRAQAIILTNQKAKNQIVHCKIGKSEYMRSIDSFRKTPKTILNFHCNDDASHVITHVYSFPHTTLTNNAKWGLGIVTGNNKKFCNNSPRADLMPIFKGSDITYSELKPPSLFIPKDLSLYQQVAPVELYEAPEKLMYKFISSNLCFFYDTRQRYILNSANMLILLKNIPITYEQLTALLNSSFMNWLFANIFSTHKILRSDLEALPIHIDFFKDNKTFSEEKYLEYLDIEAKKDGTYAIKK